MATTAYVFDCIAERELEYRETPDSTFRKAIVRLGRPYFVPPPAGEEGETAGHWVGPFEIEIEGEGVRALQTEGTDAIQALQLAMVRIGLTLAHLYPGQFTMDGEPYTGFPTSTSQTSLRQPTTVVEP